MKKLLVVIFTILFSVVGISIAHAYTLGDADDIFYVNAPAANQKVSGTINISWRMWDDDQSIIQYTAKLYDPGTCESVNYGTINSNMNGSSNKNADNNLAWNTNNTQSSTNLPDGNYCLQICAAMKNGGVNYSACNARIVKIVNHNSLPVISSNPNNLTIKESDSWTYQVTAYDSDNDPLTYSLIYGTSFLSINPQTGLLRTNSNSKVLPAGVNQVNYTIRVGVNDGISGTRTQEFTLSVVKDTPVVNPPPPVTPQPTVPPTTPVPPQDGVNTPSTIEINAPEADTIFKGEVNQIQWDISDDDGVKQIKLEYALKADEPSWKEIETLDSATDINAGGLKWDVSRIVDGEYLLRITVTDADGLSVSRVTDAFIIDNIDEEVQSQPLIINLSPESDATLNEVPTKLSGEFVPSTGSQVKTDTVKILLNDFDITSQCEVSFSTFACTIDQQLEDGKHSVNVTYTDTSDKIAGLTWTFDVNTKPEDQVLTQDNIIFLGREIPRNSLFILFVIILIFAILLIIPWILYRNWKKNQNKENNQFKPLDGYTSFTPVGSNEPYSDISTFTSSRPTPYIPNEYDNAGKVSQNLPESPAQSEIEKNLNEYWAGQSQPFQEVTPSAPQPIEAPNPVEPAPAASTYDTPKPIESAVNESYKTPEVYQDPLVTQPNQPAEKPNTPHFPDEEYMEPTPIDSNK